MTTRAEYDAAFERERALEFPEIDAFEREMGSKIERERLERAARVLACPVKANAPCWQHGRVIYAAYAHFLGVRGYKKVTMLDVGTAKGFSALCAKWAAMDVSVAAEVVSLDVIDPDMKQRRNTVAEVDGVKTLREIVAPWRELDEVTFRQAFSTTWLSLRREFVHLAFLDGKHRYDVVRDEADALSRLQPPGGVLIFDDVQIPGVARAVQEIKGYGVRYVTAKADRKYAVARKL